MAAAEIPVAAVDPPREVPASATPVTTMSERHSENAVVAPNIRRCMIISLTRYNKYVHK